MAIILTVVATAVVLFIAGVGWFQYIKVGQESDEVGGIDVTGHACHWLPEKKTRDKFEYDISDIIKWYLLLICDPGQSQGGHR